MASQKRLKWIRSTVCEGFGMREENEFENLIQQEEEMAKIKNFLSGRGPPRLFFFYGLPYERAKDSKEVRYIGTEKELKVNTGETEILQEKAIYFVRTTGNNPVNTSIESDGEVLSGEVPQAAVNVLEVVLNNVLMPMIEDLQPSDWGVCEDDHKKDFLTQMKKFSQDIHEAADTLTGVVELQKLSPQYEPEARTTGKQPSEGCTKECKALVVSWGATIDRHIKEWNDAEEQKGEPTEKGPLSELEHWHQTLRTLTGLSEQIKGSGCTTVLNLLNNAKHSSDKDNVDSIIGEWKKKESDLNEKLNEAKDNVKYLRSLEPYMEPLYSGKPTLITESMRGLMHAIKMMFTIAKHYDKGSRMTILFSKITSQMITSCISAITQGKEPEELWDTSKFPVEPLTKVLDSCLKLNSEYKKEFAEIKQKLNVSPKGKHYEFTDTVIFGKFDLFCRRITKMKDLFETIEQFQVLGRHNLENMKSILTDFQKALDDLKSKNRENLLDYKKNEFDIDFVSFNASVSQIESKLMQFINEKVSEVGSIEQSIRFLEKFKTILKRENLRKDLEQKSSVLFTNYAQKFKELENFYKSNPENPPLVRNMPEHAGKIMWLNHLYDKVARPLREFDVTMRNNKENKKCVENAWKFMKTIGLHKLIIHEKWEKRVETSKAALQSTLLIGGSDKAWTVNFETEIMSLIREAKCMSRMGMKLNENAKIILLQEEKFKTYYSELDYLIKEYNRIADKIRSNTRDILKPHLEDLETRLRPGSITLTWTSMNIDGYLQHVHEGLRKLEQFIIKINDIMDNRIENNLKDVSKTELVDLSVGGKAFALDEFVERQEKCISEKSKGLKAKNKEVEQAVADLRKAILAYERDPHVGNVSNEEMRKIVKYYYWSMYQALLHATKHSLNTLKERVCERRKDSKEPMMKPFFEVRIQLFGDKCDLNPPLTDIQNSINRAANAVLKSTKNVTKWIKGTNQTFYEWVAKDKEIVKVILLLTGSIEGTKNKVEEFKKEFKEFEWLWTSDIAKTQQEVSQRATSNEDYEKELKKLMETEKKINEIDNSRQIGAMELKTDKIKETMLKILNQWKKEYLNDLSKKVKNTVDELRDEIKRLSVRSKRTVKDLATLGEVMQTLDDIRNKESEIKIQLKPVSEIYNLLDVYLKGVQDKEEENQKKILENEWKRLVQDAEQLRTELQKQQTRYKRELINNIRSLVEEAKDFCREFREKGPNVPGIKPSEALDRLKFFKTKYDEVLKRKRENCERGEKIFNLTHKKYEELDQTDKEMNWLLSLYTLYSDVLTYISKQNETLWINVPQELKSMNEEMRNYQNKCENLDEQLKKLPAYTELKEEIDNFNKTLPLIENMSKPSILPRHWEEDLANKIKKPIVYVRETFSLGNFLDMKLITYAEEIKEISKAADEQQSIEDQLRDIESHWNFEEFVLTTTARKKDLPCALDGKKIEDIINKLEEHQTTINTMTAWRSSTPHQDKLSQASNKYSEIYDTINKIMKVQKIWQFLEPVFHTQDIAKKMVQESKKFAQIEKDWSKVIEKVNEEKNVVRCCENDMLKGLLTTLEINLDFCQKKLDTYLETKRREFPRFYFVSDTEVLNVLSQGSDPEAVQFHLASLFDGITNIEFDSEEKHYITKIMCVYSDTEKEELTLVNPVKVENQKIEDWLSALEEEMKRTVKKTIEEIITRPELNMIGSLDKSNLAFIKKYPTQICQIFLRSIWTYHIDQSRNEAPGKRVPSHDTISSQMGNLVVTLTEMLKEPRENENDTLQKIKLEGLITIQNYQSESTKNDAEFDKQKTVQMKWMDKEKGLEITITDLVFTYFYEFLKATEKLVITTLTQRCYISIAQAIKLQYGGCVVGPSGVGKTETIKDMGKTLGLLVIDVNCSRQHNVASIDKILKGIVSTGVWGTFDQFNVISRDALSIIAGQLEAITLVKRKAETEFIFPGETEDLAKTKHVESSAYFITMRTGRYVVDLPENIKVEFRQISMMVPDIQVIIETRLKSMGITTEKLGQKFKGLYELCSAQLSRQKHYDFGLRNITPVFTFLSHMPPSEKSDTARLVRAIREINIPKLVGPDTIIFNSLLKDIFKEGYEAEFKPEFEGLELVVNKYIEDNRLGDGSVWKTKIFQLYSLSQVKHGIIIVGPSGSGKSRMIQTLQESLQTYTNMQYKCHKINPKALSSKDFYGSREAEQWIDGVFTKIWEKCNKKNLKQNTWIVLDGPLDSSWIENLNSVLDENKILTLANGQRIPMTDNVRLLFEIEQMNHVEPSTISRCGILFLSLNDLGWQTIVKSYLQTRSATRMACNHSESDYIMEFIKNYIEDTNMMDNLDKDYSPSMQTNQVVRATSFITIFNSIVKQHTILDKNGYEQIFIYSIAWALGGLVEAERKDHFQKSLIEKMGAIKSLLPHKIVFEKDSIFNYYLEKDSTGVVWKQMPVEKIDIPSHISYSEIFIPTFETARAEYIINQISTVNTPLDSGMKSVLIVGKTGTAKTSSVLLYASKNKERLFKMFTFSAMTTPKILQDGIESQLMRKRARNFEPEGDKIMLMFFDDMSMPKTNKWGYQPTLELIRQLLDQFGMYFLNTEQRGDFMNLARLQFIGSMADPAAGWRDIPSRLKRLFFSFNMSMPNQQEIETVFGLLMRNNFTEKNFDSATIKIAYSLVESSSILRSRISKSLFPTPNKIHYHFTMREVGRIFQGIFQAISNPEQKVIQNAKEGISSSQFLIYLWRHECMRAFHDKLIDHEDRKVFIDALDGVTLEKYKEILPEEDEMWKNEWLFCNFLRKSKKNASNEIIMEAPKVYEAADSMEDLQKICQEKMDEYNALKPKTLMDLVLFEEAVKNLVKITRILQLQRGSLMLVGVGASGKQSLTRLACYIENQELKKVSTESSDSFFKQLKELFRTLAGLEGKPTSLLISEGEIKTEAIYEHLNSFLATGEITGMMTKEDKDNLFLNNKEVFMRESFNKEDNSQRSIYKFLITRVRDNLHFIINSSPSPKFFSRYKMFPSLFSCCNIIWFLQWPEEALTNVAETIIKQYKFDTTTETISKLSDHMASVHTAIREECTQFFERTKKQVYITPKNYFNYINIFAAEYMKRMEEKADYIKRIKVGIEKIDEAFVGLEKIKQEGDREKSKQSQTKGDVDKLNNTLKDCENTVIKEKENVEIADEKCKKQEAEIKKEEEKINAELSKARPFLADALKAANNITPALLNETKILQKGNLDITRLIIDCLMILFENKLSNIANAEFERGRGDKYAFIKDSFEEFGKTFLNTINQKKLLDFIHEEKDYINDETCELLEPYLNLPRLHEESISKASPLLYNLLEFVRGLYNYHNASKHLKPKLHELIKLQEIHDIEQSQLEQKKEALKVESIKFESLNKEYKQKNEEKDNINQQVKNLSSRYSNLNKLLNELQEDKSRWVEDEKTFEESKQKLLGDTCLASAFINYCGPFNFTFRMKIKNILKKDLEEKIIPYSADFEEVKYWEDSTTTGSWNMEGLPLDQNTIQNAILMTRAPRFPLLIDPQGQALEWIKKRERNLEGKIMDISKLEKDSYNLIESMKNGDTFIIENMPTNLPPLLEQLLDSPMGVFKKRKITIIINEQEKDVDENFMLYMVTRLPNPHISPELFSRSAVIDFTMSEKSLEHSFFSKIIMKEKRSVEEQLNLHNSNANTNQGYIKEISMKVLDIIASEQGSLIDNNEDVEELNKQKKRSTETYSKLKESQEKVRDLTKRMEQYKRVSRRATSLFLAMQDMGKLNWMYNTSLQQFLRIFGNSMGGPKKASTMSERSNNICNTLTDNVFRYMYRALYTEHKPIFLVTMAFRIKLAEKVIHQKDIDFFFKIGNITEDRQKTPFNWLDNVEYNNVRALSNHKFGDNAVPFFKGLLESFSNNEEKWKEWKLKPNIEKLDLPFTNEEILTRKDLGQFMKLCLIRCVREDRTIMALYNFCGNKDILGKNYENPHVDSLEDIYPETNSHTPVLYLLSSISDPTIEIEELCRKKLKKNPIKVSPGLENIKETIEAAMAPANINAVTWLILQNCQFSLPELNKIEELMSGKGYTVRDDFRLFLTTEPTNQFPLSLLHTAIKVTNDPTKGLRSGMLRVLSQVVSQDRMEKIEPTEKWKMVFTTMCYFHITLQERKKYGSIGFCHPYEFTNADLDSGLMYLEKLFNNSAFEESRWKIAQYMICEVLYSGKMVDERDRELLKSIGADFFKSEIIKGGDSTDQIIKGPENSILLKDVSDIAGIKKEIEKWPSSDVPSNFGLSSLAENAYRLKESKDLLASLLEIQSKEQTAGSHRSRDEEVKEKLEKEILTNIPTGFKENEKKEKKGSEPSPKQMFLNQEIKRYQAVHTTIHRYIREIIMAIEGQIIMSPEIEESVNAIHNGKVPKSWVYDQMGIEWSWPATSYASWTKEFGYRYNLLNSWSKATKLQSYWLGGFFNPKGFIFSMLHDAYKNINKPEMSLDEFDFSTEIINLSWDSVDKFDYKITRRGADKSSEDSSIYVHGLYIEGSAYNNGKFEDCKTDIISRFQFVKITFKNNAKTSDTSANTIKIPVYRYLSRGDNNLVFELKIESKQEKSFESLKKQGVAIICSRESI